MLVSFISDTHGLHNELTNKINPETDLLIHAGDFSNMGTLPQVIEFMDWFENLPIPHKVFIAGNHDFLAEKEPGIFKSTLEGYTSFHYLENEEITIEGLRIWGSPITPYFFNWAFNVHRGKPIVKYWEAIPKGLDILLTHGPAYGYGDTTTRNEKVGCEELLKRIKKVKPRYHVFGHIHEQYGKIESDFTTFINASVVNVKYQLVNEPISLRL